MARVDRVGRGGPWSNLSEKGGDSGLKGLEQRVLALRHMLSLERGMPEWLGSVLEESSSSLLLS